MFAIHGITSSSRSWSLLAQELDRPVVAPDLRGRGRSNALPGPVGLVAHADDCAAALRAVTDEPAVVVGHSMGGFVATVLAAREPGLVRALVLVDGGLPFPPVDAAATLAGLQPIKDRLRTSYTREGYRDWFRHHPAFARDWTPEVEEYADYDLPDDPGRPSADPDAVEADQLDMLESTAFAEAVDHAAAPSRLPARAPRLRRRPAGPLPAAHRRRLRGTLARPRRAAGAGRQPLHDRAQPPRRGRGGRRRRGPRLIGTDRTGCRQRATPTPECEV